MSLMILTHNVSSGLDMSPDFLASLLPVLHHPVLQLEMQCGKRIEFQKKVIIKFCPKFVTAFGLQLSALFCCQD